MNRSIFSLITAAIVLMGSPVVANAALLNASGVIGQSDYVTATTVNPPTASSLNTPNYNVIDDANHRLFVSDQINNRVTVYPLDSNDNITSSTAIYEFGQPDYVTGTFSFTPSQTNLDNNHGLAYDPVNMRLFVADQAHARVLIFDANPAHMISNGIGENASYVFGQPDFVTDVAPTPTQSGLRIPRGLAYDVATNELFVEDGQNNRVLVYDATPATLTANGNGENATYVLGQSDFISSNTATTQSGLSNSAGIELDSVNHRLFVGDLNNNRVMIYDVSAATLAAQATGGGTAENASYVIGQSDFVTATAHLTQTGLNTPRSISYDPNYNRLFVSDSINGRYMVFDVSPSHLASVNPGFGTALSAENVIGQSDYVSKVLGTTQNMFNEVSGSGPRGAAYNPLNNTLFASDEDNQRVLEIPMIRISSAGSVPVGTIGSVYSSTAPTIAAYQGTTQTFTLSSGSLPAGMNFDVTTGQITGTPFAAGTFPITIEADDNFPTGALFDRASYTLVINPIVPTVTATTAVPSLTSAVVNGTIATTGGINPTVRGFNYGTTTSYGSSTVESGSFGSGSFSASISGLACGTTYHYQTYATNTAGTGTSTPDATFITSACPVVAVSHSAGMIPLPVLQQEASLTGMTYNFISNESGLITYGGGCASNLTSAASGNNTIVFSALGAGCTIQITDTMGHASNILSVGEGGENSQNSATIVAPSHFVFTKQLDFGMTDPQVLQLQKYLNANGFPVSASGPGSSGEETNFFGNATKHALIAFQEADALDILAPLGLVHGTGAFHGSTRAYVNSH